MERDRETKDMILLLLFCHQKISFTNIARDIDSFDFLTAVDTIPNPAILLRLSMTIRLELLDYCYWIITNRLYYCTTTAVL